MTDDNIHPVARNQPPFARLLGIKIISAAPQKVVAELTATAELMNKNGVLHGGAIMALADNIGGIAAFMNIPEGTTTTTVESKTNFFRSVAEGEVVTAIAEPLHIGRRTSVWQTRLMRADGKMAAMVTQTQMVIEKL